MPRRPRPALRPVPSKSLPKNSGPAKFIKEASKRTLPRTVSEETSESSAEDDDDEGEGEDGFFVQGHSGNLSTSPSNSDEDAYVSENELDEVDEIDLDAPRVAQWEDEDDFDSEDVDGDSEDDSTEMHSSQKSQEDHKLNSLKNDLSQLPLGALRKAQRAVSFVEADNEDSDDDSLSGTDEDGNVSRSPSPASKLRKEKGKEKEWSTKPRNDISKRSNKHAPTEVTSKRPVGRFREVIEVAKPQARDPRFLPVGNGEFDARRFQKQYNFLSDMHETEASTLKENLKRARKLLLNSPRHLREEHAAEVYRLEQALKRAESAVNRDKREKVEREALEKIKEEERTRQKQGKKAWYMKDAEKKQVLMKARYEALAAEGGRGAVRKAIDKKQKKISQKEKRSRPDALLGRDRGDSAGRDVARRPNGGQDRFSGAKRPRPIEEGWRPNKKTRSF